MDAISTIIDRARRREIDLWEPFQFAIPVSDSHPTVLKLYASSGENGLVFLREIGTEELAAMADAFTIKLLDLTNDEAVLALKIATEQYKANARLVSSSAKRQTKRLKIAADLADVQAQIDALDADRADLLTRRYKADTAYQKTLVRVSELEASIAEEELQATLAAEEVQRKRIDVERARLELLGVSLEVLQVQLRINEAALESARIDSEVLEWQTRIAQVAVERLQIATQSSELANDIAAVALQSAEADLDIRETLLRIQEVATRRLGVQVDVQQIANRVAEISKRLLGIALEGDELDRATLEAIYAGMRVSLRGQAAQREVKESQIAVASASIDVTEAQTRRKAAQLERLQADTAASEIARRYVEAALSRRDIATQSTKLAAALADRQGDRIQLDVSATGADTDKARTRIAVLADAIDLRETQARILDAQNAIGQTANDVADAARRLTDADSEIAGVSSDATRTGADITRLAAELALLDIEDTDYLIRQKELAAALLANTNANARDLGLSQKETTRLDEAIAWEAERITLADAMRTWRKRLLWQGLHASLLNTATRRNEQERFASLADVLGQRDIDFAAYARTLWETEIKPLEALEVTKRIQRMIKEANGAAQAAATMCDAKIDGFTAIDDAE